MNLRERIRRLEESKDDTLVKDLAGHICGEGIVDAAGWHHRNLMFCRSIGQNDEQLRDVIINELMVRAPTVPAILSLFIKLQGGSEPIIPEASA